MEQVALLGRIGADARDAALGAADEDEAVADPHEVEGAVGGERRRGHDLHPAVALAAGGLALGVRLQQPVDREDDREHDREPDDRAGERAARTGDVRGGGSRRAAQLSGEQRLVAMEGPAGEGGRGERSGDCPRDERGSAAAREETTNAHSAPRNRRPLESLERIAVRVPDSGEGIPASGDARPPVATTGATRRTE